MGLLQSPRFLTDIEMISADLPSHRDGQRSTGQYVRAQPKILAEIIAYFQKVTRQPSPLELRNISIKQGASRMSDEPPPLETAEALYKDISDLLAKQPENERLLHHKVHASLHLLSLYVNNERLSEAEVIYEETSRLVEQHPDMEDLRAMMGEMAGMLSAYLGDAGQADKARGIYDNVKGHLARHPNDRRLLNAVLQVAFNLAVDYSVNSDDLPKLEAISRDAYELSTPYPNDAEIQAHKVRVASILSAEYAFGGNLEKAREIYRQIAATAESFPDDTNIRESQSSTAVALLAKLDELHG